MIEYLIVCEKDIVDFGSSAVAFEASDTTFERHQKTKQHFGKIPLFLRKLKLLHFGIILFCKIMNTMTKIDGLFQHPKGSILSNLDVQGYCHWSEVVQIAAPFKHPLFA